MVPILSILAMLASFLLSTIVPLVAALLYWRKHRRTMGALFLGMLGFLPQIVIRIPLIQVLNQFGVLAPLAQIPMLYAFVLAFTAGLFETAGRFVVLRLLLKGKESFDTGLMAGLGHGWFESIMLVGIGYITNLFLSLLINTGLWDVLPGIAGLDNAYLALTSTPADYFLAAGLERVFTICLHTVLSVLFMLFIVKGQTGLGFLLTLTIHTLVDFGIVMLQFAGWTVWPIELVICGIAIVSVAMIALMKPHFGDKQSPPEKAPVAAPATPPAPPASPAE